MRPVIKRRREAGDHRSSTPRTGTQPTLSVLRRGFGTPASSAFRASASLTYAVRYVRRPFLRSAYCYASSLPASHASGYSLSLHRSGLLWLAIPKPRQRPAHAARPYPCGVVCHGSASLHGTPPCFGRYEKGGRFPVPLRVLIPTLPVRPQRFRAWTIPTLSRPP